MTQNQPTPQDIPPQKQDTQPGRESQMTPRPEYQAPVRTPAGLFFPDCLWRAHGVIGECDGAVKYADPRAFVREKQREQVFRDLGFQVVRWLAEEIMFRPWEVVARVDRALAR